MIRRLPATTGQHFRVAAGGRNLTHAGYLAALVELHRRAREEADQGSDEVARLLEALGLGTVAV